MSDPELGPVEITIEALSEGAYEIPADIASGTDLDLAYSEVPERIADSRMQAWVLEVDGTKVVVVIKSYPNTSAEFVAEAEEVVRSIRVEPVETGPGRRLVFTLPANWDSG